MRYEFDVNGAGHWVVEVEGGVARIATDSFKETDSEDANVELYNAACDGVESLVLALAAEGIDVSDPKFVNAIATAASAIAENFPDDSDVPSGDEDEE